MSFPPRPPMGMPPMSQPPPSMMPYPFMPPMNMMNRPPMMPPNGAPPNFNMMVKPPMIPLIPDKAAPVTTVFVGNISERVPDYMIKQMLQVIQINPLSQSIKYRKNNILCMI